MKLEAFLRANSRGNPDTVKLYLKEIKRFTGWLGPRPLTLEACQEYEAWLRKTYKPNAITNKVVGPNLYLRWKGTDLKIRRPPKEIPANPKLISDAEYGALLGRVTDLAERLVIRILHDSFLRPSDVVAVRLADLDTSDGMTVIRMTTRKTKVVSESILTQETAAELEAYVKAAAPKEYLFDQGDGRPHHRTWPNHVLKKWGAEDVSPRTFRRTGATRWGEDLTSLMAQGGWSDPRTILKHYRKNLRERHLREFETAMGAPAKDRPDDEDPAGYA